MVRSWCRDGLEWWGPPVRACTWSNWIHWTCFGCARNVADMRCALDQTPVPWETCGRGDTREQTGSRLRCIDRSWTSASVTYKLSSPPPPPPSATSSILQNPYTYMYNDVYMYMYMYLETCILSTCTCTCIGIHYWYVHVHLGSAEKIHKRVCMCWYSVRVCLSLHPSIHSFICESTNSAYTYHVYIHCTWYASLAEKMLCSVSPSTYTPCVMFSRRCGRESRQHTAAMRESQHTHKRATTPQNSP